MAQSPDEIAKDMVVAWLSQNRISHSLSNPEESFAQVTLKFF
jgi:hypothetical protein